MREENNSCSLLANFSLNFLYLQCITPLCSQMYFYNQGLDYIKKNMGDILWGMPNSALKACLQSAMESLSGCYLPASCFHQTLAGSCSVILLCDRASAIFPWGSF